MALYLTIVFLFIGIYFSLLVFHLQVEHAKLVFLSSFTSALVLLLSGIGLLGPVRLVEGVEAGTQQFHLGFAVAFPHGLQGIEVQAAALLDLLVLHIVNILARARFLGRP